MKMIIAGFLALALSGCLTTPTPVETLANNLVESGLAVDAVLVAELNDQELDILIDAVETFKKFQARYIVDPNPSYIEVGVAYAELKGNYLVVERIVADHWDEYPASTKAELQFYQKEAKAYGKIIRAKIKAGKTAEAFTNILALGQLVVKVAAL